MGFNISEFRLTQRMQTIDEDRILRTPKFRRFTNPKAIVSWLLFSASLLLSSLLLIVEPKFLAAEYKWDVEPGSPISTELVDARPKSFTLSLIGFDPKALPVDSEILHSSNWSLRTNNAGSLQLWVEGFPAQDIGSSSGPGYLSLLVNNDPAPPTLTIGSELEVFPVGVERPLPAPLEVEEIHLLATSMVGEASLRVVTAPWGINQGNRLLLIWASVITTFLSVFLLLRGRLDAGLTRDRKASHDVAPFNLEWKISALLVTAVASVSLISLPTMVDDKWIYDRMSRFAESGLLSAWYGNLDPWQVQGAWYEALLGNLIGIGLSFEGLRLINALIVVLAWAIFARSARELNLRVPAGAPLAASSIYAGFVASFLTTVRPEPLITLLVAIHLLFFLRFLRKREASSGFLAILVAILAVGSHQTGIVIAGSSSVIVWKIASDVKSRTVSPQQLALMLSGAVSVFILAVFPLWGIRTFVREANIWLSSRDYQIADGAIERVQILGTLDPGKQFLVFFVFVIALFLSSPASRKVLSPSERLVLVGVGLAVVLINLTFSKLAWHFGALAVPATVLTFFGGITFGRLPLPRSVRRSGLFYGIFLLLGFIGLVFIGDPRSGYWDYVFPTTTNYAVMTSFGTISLGVLISVFALSFFGGSVASRIFSMRRLALSVIPAILLAPSLASVSVLTYNWIKDPGIWTPTGQRVGEFLGSTDCGLLEDLEFVAPDRSGIASREAVVSLGSGPFGLPIVEQDELVGQFEGWQRPPLSGFWYQKKLKPEERFRWARNSIDNSSGIASNSENSPWELFLIDSQSSSEIIEKIRQLPSGSAVTGLTPLITLEPKNVLGDKTVHSGPYLDAYLTCSKEPTNTLGLRDQQDFIVVSDQGEPWLLPNELSPLVEVASQIRRNGTFVRVFDSSNAHNVGSESASRTD